MPDGALCREKDVLWQKSDALEFEQKMRDEETERDVNFCLGCHTQFSWWLRKHNCRSDTHIYDYTVLHQVTKWVPILLLLNKSCKEMFSRLLSPLAETLL